MIIFHQFFVLPLASFPLCYCNLLPQLRIPRDCCSSFEMTSSTPNFPMKWYTHWRRREVYMAHGGRGVGVGHQKLKLEISQHHLEHVPMHPKGFFFFEDKIISWISVTMRASSHKNVHSFIYVSDSEHFFCAWWSWSSVWWISWHRESVFSPCDSLSSYIHVMEMRTYMGTQSSSTSARIASTNSMGSLEMTA